MTLHEMTERAVSKGQNRAEAVERLYEGFKNHRGDNLAYYLTYWNFCTSKQADKVAAEYDAKINSN